jgi:sodium-dependent dicarboxylate transporter 2/3/5
VNTFGGEVFEIRDPFPENGLLTRLDVFFGHPDHGRRGGVRFETSVAAAGTLSTFGDHGHVTEFSGEPLRSLEDLSIGDDSSPDAGSKGESNQDSGAFAGAEKILAKGVRVGVVVDRDPQRKLLPESFADIGPRPARDVVRAIDEPALRIDGAGTADPDSRNGGSGLLGRFHRFRFESVPGHFHQAGKHAFPSLLSLRWDTEAPEYPAVGLPDDARLDVRPPEINPNRDSHTFRLLVKGPILYRNLRPRLSTGCITSALLVRSFSGRWRRGEPAEAALPTCAEEGKRTVTLSRSERSFNIWRARIGFWLGPALFFLVLLYPTGDFFVSGAEQIAPPQATPQELHELAVSMKCVTALLLLMVVWWLSEAVPIPVTALLPGILLPTMHVVGVEKGEWVSFDMRTAMSGYAHPVIYLFLAGFLLAGAMQKWGLDRRLTLRLLSIGRIAESARGSLFALMLAAALLSMWISNTATTAMMLPLAIGLSDRFGGSEKAPRLTLAMLLGVAWASSIGGIGTIIGTPPNGICVGILEKQGIAKIDFLMWMKIGLPVVIVLLPTAWFLLLRFFPPETKRAEGGVEAIQEERRRLGPWSRPQILTSAVFFVAALCWITQPFWKNIFPGAVAHRLENVSVYTIGLWAAVILFLLPVNWRKAEFVLTWRDIKYVDWGVLILFGGGIALSDAMFKTGLAAAISRGVLELIGTPSAWVLVLGIVIFIDLLTEVTSNTAVTTMMVPIVIGIATEMGADPMLAAVAVALAASLAFMLPVATPPNALVYGTGRVPLPQMIRAGFWFDVAGWLAAAGTLLFFGGVVFRMFSF